MDVHPPHHPITSWREFFLHLATITVGLLIALGLEGTVEWAHHRELVGRARETLRVEMEANKRQLDANLRTLDENLVRERANLAVARQLQAGAKGLDGQFHSSLSWSGMASSAWQTAHETGALGYMPYSEVQGYDDVYVQQG